MHNNTRSSSLDQAAPSVDPKLQAEAQRAIHHHLPPSDDAAPVEHPIDNIFLVNPTLDPEPSWPTPPKTSHLPTKWPPPWRSTSTTPNAPSLWAFTS